MYICQIHKTYLGERILTVKTKVINVDVAIRKFGDSLANKIRNYRLSDNTFIDADSFVWFDTTEKSMLEKYVDMKGLTCRSLSKYLVNFSFDWDEYNNNGMRSIVKYRIFTKYSVWRIILSAKEPFKDIQNYKKIAPIFNKLISDGEPDKLVIPDGYFSRYEKQTMQMLAEKGEIKKLENGWIYNEYYETLVKIAEWQDSGKLEVRFGVAGSGKTTKTFRDLPNRANILLLSLGHKLKRENEVKARSAGCSGVVSKVIINLNDAKYDWKQFDYVVIDESTLLGVEEYALLVRRFFYSKTKVILLGDYKQLTNFTSKGCIFYSLCDRKNVQAYTLTPMRHRDPKFNETVGNMMVDGLFDLAEVPKGKGKLFPKDKEQEFWIECMERGDDSNVVLLALSNAMIAYSELLYYTQKTGDYTFLEQYHTKPESVSKLAWQMHNKVLRMKKKMTFRAICRSNLNKFGIPNGSDITITTGRDPVFKFDDIPVKLSEFIDVDVNFTLGPGMNIFNSQGQGYKTVYWYDSGYRSSNVTYVALTRTMEDISICTDAPTKWTRWDSLTQNFLECGIK